MVAILKPGRLSTFGAKITDRLFEKLFFATFEKDSPGIRIVLG
jgi:hypothetical protein